MVKPRIFVQGDTHNKKVFLTSGFQIPFQEHDLLSQIDNAALFQGFASGGAILHLFTNEELTAEEQIKLVKSILNNFPIYYMTKTPVMSVCNNCGHKMLGKHNYCENCNSDDITIWSRPIGYYRPVMRKKVSNNFESAEYKFWLDGRIKDFTTRKEVSKNDVEKLIEEINEGI